MKMVADYAEVSTATVSRVLNAHPSCTEDTIQKVMKAISELGYEPNSIAKSLRRQRSDSFITIMNDIVNPVFANMIRGIEDTAYKNNYSLIIGNTDNSFQRESEYLRAFLTRKVDGMVLITPRVKIEEIVELSQKMPVVLINDPREQSTIPTVGIDDYAAVYELTEYVLAMGHRKIAYIQGDINAGIVQSRKKGFLDCMKQNGISDFVLVEGGAGIEHGAKAMQTILKQKIAPTCVIGYNDSVTAGAIQVARRNGMKPGEDLSFCGFDDTLLAENIYPALTTLYHPTYDIGRVASELLIAMLNGEAVEAKKIEMPYKLVIRDSVKDIN